MKLVRFGSLICLNKRARGAQLYCTYKQTVFKTVSRFSVYRVVAMRRSSSPGTTNFRKYKHGFIDCQHAKYAKVALLLFAFLALFR